MYPYTDITIQQLTTPDALTVDAVWPHKTSLSLYQTMFEIEHFKCYGMDMKINFEFEI